MAKFLAHLPRSQLEKPQSRQMSQPAFSYEHIKVFTKDLEPREKEGEIPYKMERDAHHLA